MTDAEQKPGSHLQTDVEQATQDLLGTGYHAMVLATDDEYCAISVQGEGQSLMNGIVTGMMQDSQFRTMIMMALVTYRDIIQSDQKSQNETIQ